MRQQPAVIVKDLVKRYGDFVAVDGVSFTIHAGEIFGIIGPNGAGKTTTVECICGLRVPDSGSISVCGWSPQRDRGAIKDFVGVQLQESALPLVRQFALKEPGTVLAAWVTGVTPEGLTGRQEEEGWLSGLRAVFKGWQPDLAAVDALLDVIEEHTRIGSLMVALALELMRIDPLLMGRVVRCYMQEHHQKKHGDKAARTFLQQMTFDIAELPPGASRQLLRDYRTSLAKDCAVSMRLNDPVVRELLRHGVSAFNGAQLEPAQEANLTVAIDMVVPFRRALALAVLEAVAQSMT